MADKVGVALLQWGQVNLTIALLDKLRQASNLDVVAVTDNGSPDEDVEALERYLASLPVGTGDRGPKIILIRNEVNSGFSLGMNLSIQKLLEEGVDWVWVLNNDVAIESQLTANLVTLLQTKSPAIYGFGIVETKSRRFTGFYEYNLWTTRYRPVMAAERFGSIAPQNLYVSGANMVVHKHVFEAVGLLNKRTFLYFEELDFTYRARTHGFQQSHLADIEVTHFGAGSSSSDAMAALRLYHETWSMLDFYRTHHPRMLIWLLALRTPVRALLLLTSGRGRLVATLLAAVFDFLRGKNKSLVVPKLGWSRCFDGRGVTDT
jgi:GT2 family glycosyltransferase